MINGSLYKRCVCRDAVTGRVLGRTCPRLRRSSGSWSSEHGLWYVQLELPRRRDGGRRQLRRGGFGSRSEATEILDHARDVLRLAGHDHARRDDVADLLLATIRAGQPLPDIEEVRRRIRADLSQTGIPTLADYLTEWLAGLTVEANTIASYESHIRVHIIPHLGHLPVDKIRPRHIRAMIQVIQTSNAELLAAKASPDPLVRIGATGRRITGPGTVQRIRGTLRKALNDALAEELIAGTNPATLVKTPYHRALPMIWEDERVTEWQTNGTVPSPVMVWTGEQLNNFLAHAAAHDPDLHPLFHLIAYRGPRRGEACGLRDRDVHLAKHEVVINNQITAVGHTIREKRPKSRASNRILVLDADTAAALAAYKARRAAQQLAAGPDWPATGLFFVRPDGQPWHPNAITARFRRLVRDADLPPVRLHDLRHVAATMALDAGVDIKVVQEQLGHSISTLTRDTYQSVSKHLHREAADAVARRIAEDRGRSA